MTTTLIDGTMDLGAAPEQERLERELGAKMIDGWFTRLVTYYLRRHARRAESEARPAAGTETARAEAACRRACLKSAFTGAAAGVTATGATLATASTEGLAAFVAVPIAAGGILGEMVYRAFVHVELTCELARIFDIAIDPEDPRNVWRLYALAFSVEEHDVTTDDPGQGLVDRILHVQGEKVGEKIGGMLVGESVVRNVVPVLGVATSSYANYRLTDRLGGTLRRAFRYRRALEDALSRAGTECSEVLDLLVEGLWFVFIADGKLMPEEAAALASMLRRFPVEEQRRIQSGFVEDELPWMDRLRRVPESLRGSFFHALEVAATVDKVVSLPERKLLRRVARELGVEFDAGRLDRMMKEFETVGVLR